MRFAGSLILIFFLPLPAFAMQFSEVAYDIVGSDDKHEWIELINNGTQSVNLTGYYFYDDAYHTLAVPPEKSGQGSLIVEPGQYIILADDTATFLADHPGYAGTVIDTVMSLKNYSSSLSEPINLKLTNTQKETVAESSYLPTQNGSSGNTLELKEDGQWYDSAVIGGSPGSQNSGIKIIVHSTGIRFSEVLPNPAGEDSGNEWFELENTTGSAVDVGEWYVIDKPTASGSTHRHTFAPGTVIAPYSFAKFSIEGSMLNNTDETLGLFWPDAVLIETVEVGGGAKDDWSFARISDNWQWTDQVTPSASNKAASVTSESNETSLGSSLTTAKKALDGATNATSAKPMIKTSPTSSTKADSQKSSQKSAEPKGTKKSAGKLTAKLEASNLPTKTQDTGPLPTAVSQVAGVDSEKPANYRLLAIILLPIVTLAFILSVLTYRYKLLLILPKLRELWPPDIIK